MRKAKPISDREFDLEYKTAFKTVFEYNRMLEGIWFSQTITHCLFLYPQIFKFNSIQIKALCESISEIGDNEFIITLTELLETKNSKHWLIPLEDVQAYDSIGLNSALENTIYSPNGLWGIKFTMDQYAVVGGTKIFIDNLKARWPSPIDDQIFFFLNDIRQDYQNSQVNLSWLQQFLKHIYGKKKAQELLRNARLI